MESTQTRLQTAMDNLVLSALDSPSVRALLIASYIMGKGKTKEIRNMLQSIDPDGVIEAEEKIADRLAILLLQNDKLMAEFCGKYHEIGSIMSQLEIERN